MKQSRRQFLKVASLSFLGFAGGSLLPNVAKAAVGDLRPNQNEAKATHWGMVIDTRRFTKPEDFKAIIDVCHSQHNVPKIDNKQEIKWIWTDGYKQTFTDQMDNYPAQAVLDRDYLMLCNHCENPACVKVCPTQATFRRADGVVVMDYHRCIGCRYCMAGCPYGARSFNFKDPRSNIDVINTAYPTRSRGVVEKCTFCHDRLDKGLMPLCVEASDGAIVFGDLDDPESDVRKVLAENFTIRRKPTAGTEPSVYYII